MRPTPEQRSRKGKPEVPGAPVPEPRRFVGHPDPLVAVAGDDDLREILDGLVQPPVFTRSVYRDAGYPEIVVSLPDEWDSVLLAPLFDVHLGSPQHDKERFEEHVQWILDTPNAITFLGGDLIDFGTKGSPGSSVYEQSLRPEAQIDAGSRVVATLSHKCLFALEGNHEARSREVGIAVTRWMAERGRVPAFSGYALCRIQWRGRAFTLLAHHGTGSAQTAGAQLNGIRKELPWAHGFDLYWFGHLHRSLHSKEPRIMWNPLTGRMAEREGYCIMSPSYLRSFGGYAERARLPITTRGMVVVALQSSGRMDLEEHAHGERF